MCNGTLKMGLPFDPSNSTSNNLLFENTSYQGFALALLMLGKNKSNKNCQYEHVKL